MNKEDFLLALRKELSGLPEEELVERLAFYREIIDDKIEEGFSEEEAVAEMGPADKIVSQILSDIPMPKLVKDRIKAKRRLQAWEIVLLILGSPIWISLSVCALALVLSVYLVIWVMIISVWAVDLSLAVSAPAAAAAGFMKYHITPVGPVLISAGLILAGLSIFLFFGCRGITKGALSLTKRTVTGIKTLLIRKDGSK